MKLKAHTMLSAMVIAELMVTGPAAGGETDRAELEVIVDNYISACEAKSAMLHSRSVNIRRAAMLSCLRAALCRTSKAELVDELVAKKIEAKPYKVHHFLNARFKSEGASNQLASK